LADVLRLWSWDKDTLCALKGVRNIIESMVGKPGIRWTALSSYAAGVTGIVANLFLIAFFTLPDNLPLRAASFGPANDLVGSLGNVFMIPVAVALSAWLPERLFCRIIQVLGLLAMAVLVVGGPLLVLGVLEFEVQAPIMLGAWVILSLWLFLVNRWLRPSGALPPRTARFGEAIGGLVLVAGGVAGLGLLLPWMSLLQLILFVAGGVLAVIGMMGTPFWFLFLGRYLGRS
jgi:hypothetical protein